MYSRISDVSQALSAGILLPEIFTSDNKSTATEESDTSPFLSIKCMGLPKPSTTA